jgi:peroxiredoxin
MALTPSRMVELGAKAPDFSLPDVDGRVVSLGDYHDAPGLLVIFMCNHCPYVKHIRASLAEVTSALMKQGLGVVGINSNDVALYPADSPEKMKEEKAAAGYPFAYLFDATQAVAKAYQAECTPDLFLYDKHRKLVYRGQWDASRPGSGIPVTGKDIKEAAEQVLKGMPVTVPQVPSIGCNIKWKTA